jgi:hypothetical protein
MPPVNPHKPTTKAKYIRSFITISILLDTCPRPSGLIDVMTEFYRASYQDDVKRLANRIKKASRRRSIGNGEILQDRNAVNHAATWHPNENESSLFAGCRSKH